MNNQEAAYAFAEKLKKQKFNESKTDKAKDNAKMYSLKIRETNLGATKLSEE